MATIRDYTRRDNYVNEAIRIANDNSHGYSQGNRWGNPDYDCSSLAYSVLYPFYPGLNKNNPRYTGTMVRDFTQIGFIAHPYDGNLSDLEPGDFLLSDEHTALYIGGGQLVEASSSETGGIDGEPGDQTGQEIHVGPVYQNNWRWVLEPPADYIEIPDNPPGTMRRGILWEYHGGNNQKFNLVHHADGTVSLIDCQYGLALDLYQGKTEDCNGVNFFTYIESDAQKWHVWPIIGPSMPDSVAPHIIASSINPAKILDGSRDAADNGNNGTKLIVYQNQMLNNNKNQIWYIEDNLDGTWVIRSAEWPKLVVDVSEEIPF